MVLQGLWGAHALAQAHPSVHAATQRHPPVPPVTVTLVLLLSTCALPTIPVGIRGAAVYFGVTRTTTTATTTTTTYNNNNDNNSNNNNVATTRCVFPPRPLQIIGPTQRYHCRVRARFAHFLGYPLVPSLRM